MIMEAKRTKVNDLWARTLKIFNCVRSIARPLRLTSTAASSTLSIHRLIALGPLRATAAAGPTPAVLRKSVNLGSGAGSQMCFQERRARILLMFDVDMPKRSANELWVTLPFA
jgi:hypothetical protein